MATSFRFSSLDLHPKTLDEFRVRTREGGVISLLCLAVIAWLFVSELSYYLGTDVVHELGVDHTLGETLRINFNLTFQRLSCASLGLDAMDASGEHQSDVMHHVYKTRLDSYGRPLGRKQRHELTDEVDTVQTHEQLGENKAEMSEGKMGRLSASDGSCGDCYGAGAEHECCDTCAEVRAAYRRKGWAFDIRTAAREFVQCREEGLATELATQRDEGCMMNGYLEVAKAQGNFHFAPQRAFQMVSLMDLLMFSTETFNVSHVVNDLSFGEPIPGIVSPLDGQERVVEVGAGMFQYFVKLIPTDYEYADGSVVSTNAYSVTEHYRTLGVGRSSGNLPGVYFYYDLSPLRMRSTAKRRSLSHFLTSLCAILGGVFTVMGMVDRFVDQGLRQLGQDKFSRALGGRRQL